MSVWQQYATQDPSPLCGVEGDLLSLRVTVEAFLLEDLLELLADAPFPLNPEIRHHATMQSNGGVVPAVHVEFPLWRSQIDALRELLGKARFETELGIAPMLEEIRA
ncbi:MAG: hypothetical protein HY820_32300 [Acidobacteria bacterium]|nr:hypothetical protein [Acidobacteriota bacterium]